MYLTNLTALLMALIVLSIVMPSLWQGLAILVVLVLMAMDAHHQPPLD